MLEHKEFSKELVDCLLAGGVAVIRTDTLYGLVARASDQVAVERIYRLKSRDDDKASIVLISSVDNLLDKPNQESEKLLKQLWPGPISIILPSVNAPLWVTRGNDSVAYRLPDDKRLLDLIDKTGPLVAPSANPQGLPPANDIEQARQYFGELVDMYVDGGEVTNPTPSQLVRISDGQVERLR